MKIYKVRVEYETVIRAEDAADARAQANRIIRQECDAPPLGIEVHEVNSVTDLPYGWDAWCRPWGERDPSDRTLGMILTDPTVK